MTRHSTALDLMATRRWLDRRTRAGGDDEAEGLRQVRAAGAERVGRALVAEAGPLPPGQEALGWLRAAAEGGNSDAMVRLGSSLVDHPDSFQEGERWLHRAAEAGDPLGKFNFGRLMLFMGRNDEAEPWLDAAIEVAPPLAMELVDELRSRGATELAGRWTRRAAEAGNPAAAIALSVQASEDGDPTEAQRWGEWAHQLGDDDAEIVLAVAAQKRGDEQSERRWLERAVARGHPLAAALRGLSLFRDGLVDQARPLLVQAAQADIDDVLPALAGIYLSEGRTEEALILTERAASHGDAEAAYVFGEAVAEAGDWPRAIRAFELAAQLGHAKATVELGRALLVERRPAEAVARLSLPIVQELEGSGLLLGMAQAANGQREAAKETFAAAARAGDGRAAHKLGLLYGEEGDLERSIAWYERAAGVGEASAMFNLGRLFQDRDPEGARRWLIRATEQGHVEAPHVLAVLALQAGRNADALVWLQRAVEAGNPKSMELLAALPATATANRTAGPRRSRGG